MVRSVNPRTGEAFGPKFLDTSFEDVEAIIAKLKAAFLTWSSTPATKRAEILDEVAAAIDAASSELVEIEDSETALGIPRLPGEVARTTFQLRQFSEALRAGKFITAEIELIEITRRRLAKPTPFECFLFNVHGRRDIFSRFQFKCELIS